MLESWRERRRLMKRLKVDAKTTLPRLQAAKVEVEAAARDLRQEFQELPGFPPSCPRCGRSLVYQRVQLSRKKWRWMWLCRGECHYTIYDAQLRRERSAS